MVVANMPASLAFYRMLGLDIPEEQDAQPHVEAKWGSTTIAWDSVEMVHSFDSSYVHAQGPGRISLAFQQESAGHVDTLYQRMIDAGFTGHIPPWDAFWGQRYAALHDPDGNTIDVYASLDVESDD